MASLARSLLPRTLSTLTGSQRSMVLSRPVSFRAALPIPRPKPQSVEAQQRNFRVANSHHQRHRQLGVDETKNPEEAVNSILYNTPEVAEKRERHLLQALVSDEPGVLSKVSGVLAARGFNIDSLVVSATEVPTLSRMTIVLKGADTNVEQARKQLEDMVPVWAVIDFTHAEIIERELLLIKVSVKPDQVDQKDPSYRMDASTAVETHLKRQAVTELTNLFGGRIVDVSLTHCTIELSAESKKLDGFIHMLKPFGIIESSRSGVMAVSKTPFDVSIGRQVKIEESADVVDATSLPPS